MQQAIVERGGVSKIRCLAARKEPAVEIDVELKNGSIAQHGVMASVLLNRCVGTGSQSCATSAFGGKDSKYLIGPPRTMKKT